MYGQGMTCKQLSSLAHVSYDALLRALGNCPRWQWYGRNVFDKSEGIRTAIANFESSIARYDAMYARFGSEVFRDRAARFRDYVRRLKELEG